MPRIFDNINTGLLPALKYTLSQSYRADFAVGYFNLRGWKLIDASIENWMGDVDHRVRLLIGMQSHPDEELRNFFAVNGDDVGMMDQSKAVELRKKVAQDFHHQLTIGTPSNDDETALRRLAAQVRAGKVVVKLYTKTSLHAKLYLLFRQEQDIPIIGYLGSSNLTFAGLKSQGELNVDVTEVDAARKLADWFDNRWNERLCLDISEELCDAIENSWAREEIIPPYHIYIKIAYHLSQDARAGISQSRIPLIFRNHLLSFQEAAVKIAAHNVQRYGGAIIGDVVGLGKTMMATAVAKIFEEEYQARTLIICPVNLVPMWEQYCHDFMLHAKIVPLSQFPNQQEKLWRYGLVVIDESHNLRNREGVRYKSIHSYIQNYNAKVLLLTATPYNKTYLDLSNQLRLFVADDLDLGVRPEQLIREIGETELSRCCQYGVRTLSAFEKSDHVDDWRELMRRYLVRRPRTFIKLNYGVLDPQNGRYYLQFPDGTRSYFPDRVPRTIQFQAGEQYDSLYSQQCVDVIERLALPRYGLGNYIHQSPIVLPNDREARQLEGLSRAGRRLMGFCRTNLFKRLESSGSSFLLSLERHILRNYVYLHAIENDLDLPLGTQDVGLLEQNDEDADARMNGFEFDDSETQDEQAIIADELLPTTQQEYRRRAAQAYQRYSNTAQSRFNWIRPTLFAPELAADLQDDAEALAAILEGVGQWIPENDGKLQRLITLLQQEHPNDKVLIFSQFADTVRYLHQQLLEAGIERTEAATGGSSNPTELAYRFSPVSNRQEAIPAEQQLQILVATDVLSEGQNLQDCAIVVNYDIPWAIIRLIQRAGRVDRIGQAAPQILCYSFWPQEGVEKVIALRSRVQQRLQENAEVIGTDERFGFEDAANPTLIHNLYNERSGTLEDDQNEVDLSSYAYQIWNNAITREPQLKKIIPKLPNVVNSTKRFIPSPGQPEGVLIYTKTAEGSDALTWMDTKGKSITESQFEILRAAACEPSTPGMEHHPSHHGLVGEALQNIANEAQKKGANLGSRSSARSKLYYRLTAYLAQMVGTVFDTQELRIIHEQTLTTPLKSAAIDTVNRMFREGVKDEEFVNTIVALHQSAALLNTGESNQQSDPTIICSMGLFQ